MKGYQVYKPTTLQPPLILSRASDFWPVVVKLWFWWVFYFFIHESANNFTRIKPLITYIQLFKVWDNAHIMADENVLDGELTQFAQVQEQKVGVNM